MGGRSEVRIRCGEQLSEVPCARIGATVMRGAAKERLDILVVSHPSVLAVNQLVYAELLRRGWGIKVVVPEQWRHDYSPVPVRAEVLPELQGRILPRRVVMAGRPQRHFYLADPFRELGRFRPRTLFCEQEAFSLSAAQWGVAAWRRGIPFGIQIDENLDRRMPFPVRRMRREVLKCAAFIAARSPTAASLARSWGATGQISLVPHHVPSWGIPADIRSRVFTIGYAGRLVPEKGLDILVEAVRGMSLPVELLVVGDGPMRPWLEAQDLGRARLRLLTGVKHGDMVSAYAQMDVVVLPSRTTLSWAEQFGRVLVEALWCEKPVVGSDSGEIPWVIESTGGGLIFPEGDDHALAALLTKLWSSPALRTDLGRQGREAVQHQFSVSAVADRLEQLLTASGGGRGGRAPIHPPRPLVALVAHAVHDHGGMERACAELIRRLHGEVRFVVVSAELAQDLRPMVERWYRVRLPMRPIPLKFVWFYVRAGGTLAWLRADLVHSIGAIVPNRVDVVTVHFCHAGFAAVTRRLSPTAVPFFRQVNTALARALGLAAERWSYRSGRLRSFAAVSNGVAAELAAHYPGIPCTITPNGVDSARFTRDVPLRQAMRIREGVKDSVVAIFVGGDWDRKGLAVALEAVGIARHSGVDFRLWVVGHGDQQRFADLARTAGADGAVRWWGRRSDVADLYRTADVFVLPSIYETFSMAAFEAAACRLPLVVTAFSGAPDALVGNDEGGRIVERDPMAVAKALVEIGRDDSLRTALGDEAHRRSALFGWQGSVDATLALYRSLLRGTD